MMREGRTLTRTIEIETRQHELMGVDLGEGIPRRAMLWGAAIITAWCLPLGLIFGAPSPAALPLWILPPVLLAVYGWRESPSNPRRRRVTEWVLAVRWVLTGHRPVVALGRQRGRRGRTRPLVERIGTRYAGGDLLALVMPWRLQPADQPTTDSEAAPVATAQAGRVIQLGSTVQLVGNDEAQRQVRRLGRRSRRPDSAVDSAPGSAASSATSRTTSRTTSNATTRTTAAAGEAHRRRRRSARRGRRTG